MERLGHGAHGAAPDRPVTWGAILPEERYLRAKFGSPYTNYAARVRRWL